MRFVVSLALDCTLGRRPTVVTFLSQLSEEVFSSPVLPFWRWTGADLFLLADLTIQWSHWGLLYADKTYLWLILILSIPANSMSSISNLRRSIQQICFISHTCLLAFFKLTCVLCLGSPNAGVVCTDITKTSVGIRRYHGKKIRCVSLCSINWPYIPLSHQENQQILKRRGTSSLKVS